MTARSLIVLEANEIPWKVFDHFCRTQPQSAIARLMDRGRQFRTHAEDRARFIMPWTTWPSLHRGVHDEVHQIFKFGQWETETNKQFPPIWSLLSKQGIRTGVFSSMQSSPLPENSSDYSFYLPDMFSTQAATQPEELQIIQEFNLVMTRQSARNVSRGIDVQSAARVLLNSRKLGIRLSTYVDVGLQLASEMADEAKKVRRRAYQPVILFDVFYKQLTERRPQFCTFFTNHVAAAMHRYWAAAFPEDYDDFQLERSWVDRYKGEIDFAMLKLNSIAKRLMNFVDANPDYALAVATSMGQAAIPASHVKEFLTLTDIPAFMKAMGLAPGDYEERPAMVPDFSFSIAPGKANDFENALRGLTVAGKPPDIHRDGRFFHVSLHDETPGLQEAKLRGVTVPTSDIGIGYMIHEDDVACTAQHVPEGTLLVYSPHSSTKAHNGRVDISALEFAPSVLKHFGLPTPGYMKPGMDLFS